MRLRIDVYGDGETKVVPDYGLGWTGPRYEEGMFDRMVEARLEHEIYLQGEMTLVCEWCGKHCTGNWSLDDYYQTAWAVGFEKAVDAVYFKLYHSDDGELDLLHETPDENPEFFYVNRAYPQTMART